MATIGLPGMLLGTRMEARRGVRKVLDAAIAGQEIDVPLVDASDPQQLLVIEPRSMIPPGDHFHLYLLITVTGDSDARLAHVRQIFLWLLRRPWGPLCLLGQEVDMMAAGKRWMRAEDWTEYLAAFVRWWPEYLAFGSRFLSGPYAKPLWGRANPFVATLADFGLPKELLRLPLPEEGGLEALLRKFPEFSDVLARVDELRAGGA
jgi:hypothetical protein